VKIYFVLIFFCISSCAVFNNKNQASTDLTSTKANYKYIDAQGELPLHRNILFEESKHKLSTMIKLIDPDKKENEVVEKIISVSEVGSLKKRKKKRNILRPNISQFTTWLEGKKYFSQIKVLPESRELLINLDSPEEKWSGERKVALPRSLSMYCFFTQIAECLKFSNVLFELKKNPNSSMKFGIIWESYPYMSEQWENFPTEAVSPARVTYEGDAENGDSKYNVEFNGQVAFYHFDKKFELRKFLWVAQGISILR
jgi:hypothetical protein